MVVVGGVLGRAVWRTWKLLFALLRLVPPARNIPPLIWCRSKETRTEMGKFVLILPTAITRAHTPLRNTAVAAVSGCARSLALFRGPSSTVSCPLVASQRRSGSLSLPLKAQPFSQARHTPSHTHPHHTPIPLLHALFPTNVPSPGTVPSRACPPTSNSSLRLFSRTICWSAAAQSVYLAGEPRAYRIARRLFEALLVA